MVQNVGNDQNAKTIENLKIIHPELFAKGYEYGKNDINPRTKEEKDVLESFGGEIIFTPGDIIYSSSHLIELSPPNIAVEKLMTLMGGEKITFDDLRAAVEKMKGLRLHVLGDTIVDSYTQCSMTDGQTRSEERSGGQECVSPCSSRWTRDHSQNKYTKRKK